MTIIERHEKLLGKRWREWTQEERIAVACTLEEPELRIPLLINMVMEAYLAGAKELMRTSTVTMIEKVIAQKENRHENHQGIGPCSL
jgi:hypothetical protein